MRLLQFLRYLLRKWFGDRDGDAFNDGYSDGYK